MKLRFNIELADVNATIAIGAALVLGVVFFVSRGNGYARENCSQYVCHAQHQPVRTAREIWDGKGMVNVGDYASLAQAEIMHPMTEGDIIAFHGAHVAWFHNGVYMDSDPRHDGPGVMQYDATDLWFAGPVRIRRFKQ